MLSPLTYLVIMIVLAAAGYFWLVHWSKLSLKKRGMDDRQANEAVHLAGKYSPLLTWARSVLVPDLATAGQHIKTWAARRICLRRQAADEGAEPSQSIADAEAQVIRRDELQIVHEEVTTDHAPSEIQQPAPVEKRKAEVRFQADLLAGQRFQVVVEGIRESAAAVGQGAAASGITNTGITQETVSFGVTSRQVEGMAVSPAASYAVTSPMPEPAEVLPAVSLSDFASPKAVNQVATVLLVGGIGLLAASLMVRQDIPVGKREALLLPGLSGLVMVMLAIYAQGRKSSSDWFQRVAFVLCNWLRISALQGICLITGLMAVVLGCIAAGDSAFLYNPILAVTGWLGGTGLVLVGAWRRTGGRPAISWRMWAWIGVIGLAALLMRVVDTAHIPVVLLGDEGSAGLSAINFINGQTNNIFGMGWRSFPALSFFIQSIFIKAFGNTIEALRVPAGVVGALTVIAAMLMARAMFSERVAILTGVFLAAFHYHIHFSRIGLNNVYDPLFYVITLGALWYGWHKERREYFLIAGLALGLAQY
ncbi:MAG: glycosyltransferase family 39 protein, partial [Anaerolineales bacterium]|nr:glycosyltransferase family 39 protein [Anaerolineales bacterium]